MIQERFSSLPMLRQALPPKAVVIACIVFLLLNVTLTFVMAGSLFLGAAGMLGIGLMVFFFSWPHWAIPIYILIATPSIALPLGNAGIFSRFYAGNIALGILVIVGIVQILAPQRETRQRLLPASLMAPSFALVLVGLSSILYSRLQPDSGVTYSFPHTPTPLILVNTVEMVLLLGLPAVVIIVPGIIRTAREADWIVKAFIGIGLLYALGTIFAGPLGLYSQQELLGYQRPQVFGEISSGLGMLLVFFTCIALGRALYARTQATFLGWSLLIIIFAIGVIMSFGRESWIALFFSVLVMIGFRIKSLAILFIMAVFLLLLFVPGVLDFFDPSKAYGADRLVIWQDAIAIWLRHPYFGVGAGNFQFFDVAYGTDVAGVAHNQYLEVLAEMGVQGLLCLIWGLIAIGRIALQRFKTATTSLGQATSLAYLGYYVAIIIGGFFADTFLPSAAGGGGTATLIGASYRWLLLGLVLITPRWEKSASAQAIELVLPVKKQSQLEGRPISHEHSGRSGNARLKKVRLQSDKLGLPVN